MPRHFFATSLEPQSSAPITGPTLTRSGTLASSETWENQRVEISGDLRVDTGQDLLINGGTEVVFLGNFWIEVRGGIKIKGTPGNRVTIGPDIGVASWYGIILGSDNGGFSWGLANPAKVFEFEYVDFTKGKKSTRITTGDRHHLRGGCIAANDPQSLVIDNCTFSDSNAIESGGAVYINGHASNKDFTLSNCTFINCIGDAIGSSGTSQGGALKQDHGNSLSIVNCTFSGSSAGSSWTNVPNVSVNTSSDTLTTPGGVAHELTTASSIHFSGSPPAPLVAGVEYYAIPTGATTWKIANSIADANTSTAINLTSSGGSFTTTIHYDWYGFDNSATRT